MISALIALYFYHQRFAGRPCAGAVGFLGDLQNTQGVLVYEVGDQGGLTVDVGYEWI